MENHPIPQDVTGFKFKLIGSITVKQFLYLLGFGILATIVFVLHINFLIRIPIMLILAGIGAALAFIPIEGRPMDVMIANFAKTIPAENRFIYKKRGAALSSFEFLKIDAPVKITVQQTTSSQNPQNNIKKAQLISRLRNTGFKPDDQEAAFLKNINSAFSNPQDVVISRPTTPVSVDAIPTEEPLAVTPSPEEKPEQQAQIPQPVQITPPPTITASRVPPVTKVETMDQTQKDQEFQFQNAIQNKPQEEAQPQTAQPAQTEDTAPIPPAPPQAGFPSLPDVGNVVLGLVRDPRGRSLPNILVEVTDSNQTPVRAFKTNALGQFASATPLPNGEYKVSFEDSQGKHEFETISIILSGQIFNPLDITSVDSREKLRRELFGGQPTQTA